jgi:hypothetical protein
VFKAKAIAVMAVSSSGQDIFQREREGQYNSSGVKSNERFKQKKTWKYKVIKSESRIGTICARIHTYTHTHSLSLLSGKTGIHK